LRLGVPSALMVWWVFKSPSNRWIFQFVWSLI
jgi:hypothetical protein